MEERKMNDTNKKVAKLLEINKSKDDPNKISLTHRINDLEQYTRRDNIKIQHPWNDRNKRYENIKDLLMK